MMELQTIHQDERGSIHVLVGDLVTAPEVTIFKTKARYARGGCIHNKSREHLVVIEGTIQYVYAIPIIVPGEGHGYDHADEVERMQILRPTESISIEPNIPHYYISLTDSVVMEWGPTLEEKKGKDKRFRGIVDELNKLMRQYRDE